MKMQLEELVSLQELDSRLDAFERAETGQQGRGRRLSLEEAGRLRAQRQAITRSLRPEFLRYYERVRQRHARAIVATSHGTCMGCFTLRPTSMASRSGGFETCERCGRILIRLEDVDSLPAPERVVKRAGKETLD